MANNRTKKTEYFLPEQGETGYVIHDGWFYEEFDRQDVEWMLRGKNKSTREQRLSFLRRFQSLFEWSWLPDEDGTGPNEWSEDGPELDEETGEVLCTGSKFVADRYEIYKSSRFARCLSLAIKGGKWSTKLGWWESSRLEVKTDTERKVAVDYLGDLMDHLGDLIHGEICESRGEGSEE